jgi:hypothetical protein
MGTSRSSERPNFDAGMIGDRQPAYTKCCYCGDGVTCEHGVCNCCETCKRCIWQENRRGSHDR